MGVPLIASLATPPSTCVDAPTKHTAERRFHTLVGAAGGYCTRQDLMTGGSGPCGEVATGQRVTFGADWHTVFELVAGVIDHVRWGDAAVGSSTTSGGFYPALRWMGEYDPDDRFFVRFGAQLRLFPVLNWGAGAGGVLELGTFFEGAHLEVGWTFMAGADPVASESAKTTSTSFAAFVMGTSLFTRFRL